MQAILDMLESIKIGLIWTLNLYILLSPFFVVIVLLLVHRFVLYSTSIYGKESGNSFFKTIFNLGNYGEFLTFRELERIQGYKRICANVYLPLSNGETTEVDLIMFHETGIYVIESKNYSGWIFGSENDKMWTQVLSAKRKNKFYNPVLQNRIHVDVLSKILRNVPKELFKSYIVFSQRCELKKVDVREPNTRVIKRPKLKETLLNEIKNSPVVLTKDKIDILYSIISEFSHASEEEKKRHIETIKKRKSKEATK